MLEMNVKIRDSLLQLQGVYIVAVEEYLKKNNLKVLDELADIKIQGYLF